MGATEPLRNSEYFTAEELDEANVILVCRADATSGFISRRPPEATARYLRWIADRVERGELARIDRDELTIERLEEISRTHPAPPEPEPKEQP